MRLWLLETQPILVVKRFSHWDLETNVGPPNSAARPEYGNWRAGCLLIGQNGLRQNGQSCIKGEGREFMLSDTAHHFGRRDDTGCRQGLFSIVRAAGSPIFTGKWRRLAIAALMAIATLPAQQPSEAELNKLAAQMDKALGLHPGISVADIGTGAAVQHPIRIANEIAPGGKVICVEVSQSYVERIKKRIDGDHIVNMEVVLGREDNPLLAAGAFDAILISNTYHEFSQPEVMLQHIREALKPDGTLVVIENYSLAHRTDSRAAQAERHDMTPEILESELAAAGFTVKERIEPVLVNSPDRPRYLVRAAKNQR